MNKLRVLSFVNFHGINESDSLENKGAVVSSSANQILDIFFQAYTVLSVKVENYQDETSDLIDIKEAPVEKRGDVILSTMVKIAKKVDKIYADAAFKLVDAAKELKNAYDSLITTEDGKKDLENINKAIYASVDNFVKVLSDTNRKYQSSIKESIDLNETRTREERKADRQKRREEKKEKREKEQNEKNIERNTYPKSRKELIDKIAPIISRYEVAINNPISEAQKSACQKAVDELKKFSEELSNESAWVKMNKKDSTKRIEEIRTRVNEIELNLSEYLLKAVEKMGFDKKVASSIEKARELVKDALKVMSDEEEEDIKGKEREDERDYEERKEDDAPEGEEGGGPEDEEGGEGEGEGDDGNTVDVSEFKTIKFGANSKTVLAVQRRMNKILPKPSRIAEDGKFGAGTSKAIKMVSTIYSHSAPALLGKLSGKSITPGLQAFLINREKNKDVVKELVRYKGKIPSGGKRRTSATPKKESPYT